MAGRLIAIGDIHGHITALNALIDAIQPTPEDRLIFLGDYIDRGPDSKAVLERLITLQDQYQCHFIMGNHEEMMFESLYDPKHLASEWMRVGGDETMKSYHFKTIDDVIHNLPETHRKFLEICEDAVELENYIFVHAAFDPDKDMKDQDIGTLRYQFLEQAKDTGRKRIICGHTPQRSGKPVQKGQITCIDTGMGLIPDGLLTAYDLTHEIFTQADRNGKIRTRTAKELLETYVSKSGPKIRK